MNQFGVISVDPDKVWIENAGDKQVVVKIVSLVELEHLHSVREWLLQGDVACLRYDGRVFCIELPEVISNDKESKMLRLDYCSGENLEIMLKTTFDQTRVKWITMAQLFFAWMKENGFLWSGIAPRHIIVNEQLQKIYIVDFERELKIIGRPVNEEEFIGFLYGTVHEEFCAFLFEDEQKIVFPELWSFPQKKFVPRISIRSTRQVALLEKLFGELNEFIPREQLSYVQKLMSFVVTPVIVNGEPFFPLEILEKIKGIGNYVQTIIELSVLEKRYWKNFLERKLKDSSLCSI